MLVPWVPPFSLMTKEKIEASGHLGRPACARSPGGRRPLPHPPGANRDMRGGPPWSPRSALEGGSFHSKPLTPPWTTPLPPQEGGPLSEVSAGLKPLGHKPLHDNRLWHVSLNSDLSNEHRKSAFRTCRVRIHPQRSLMTWGRGRTQPGLHVYGF